MMQKHNSFMRRKQEVKLLHETYPSLSQKEIMLHILFYICHTKFVCYIISFNVNMA